MPIRPQVDFSEPRNIERLMAAMGLNQSQFAAEVAAAPSSVSGWLSGKIRPGKRTVRLFRCLWEHCRLVVKLRRLNAGARGGRSPR